MKIIKILISLLFTVILIAQDSLNMSLISQIEFANSNYSNGIALFEDILYVGNTNSGIQIIDISSIEKPADSLNL
jgi:hypothetical protein